jgi:hypothetical protein
MDVNPDRRKAYSQIICSLESDSNVSEDKFRQRPKHPAPSDSTEDGITAAVNLDEMKASASTIRSAEFGSKIMDSKRVQLERQFIHKHTTEAGTTILHNSDSTKEQASILCSLDPDSKITDLRLLQFAKHSGGIPDANEGIQHRDRPPDKRRILAFILIPASTNIRLRKPVQALTECAGGLTANGEDFSVQKLPTQLE